MVIDLVGGLVAMFYFPIYWVANHPNWRNHIFPEGWPNHQPVDLPSHWPLGISPWLRGVLQASQFGTENHCFWQVYRCVCVWYIIGSKWFVCFQSKFHEISREQLLTILHALLWAEQCLIHLHPVTMESLVFLLSRAHRLRASTVSTIDYKYYGWDGLKMVLRHMVNPEHGAPGLWSCWSTDRLIVEWDRDGRGTGFATEA